MTNDELGLLVQLHWYVRTLEAAAVVAAAPCRVAGAPGALAPASAGARLLDVRQDAEWQDLGGEVSHRGRGGRDRPRFPAVHALLQALPTPDAGRPTPAL